MAKQITNSPDISSLDFDILYDISGATPSITLTNESVGIGSPSGLDACTWWYSITTPLGISIHAGSQTNPDVTMADWDTLTIPNGSWPTPFGTPPYGQVEMNCSVPYTAILYVMDSNSNIYSLQKQQLICRPNGNTDKSRGNFGVADVQLTTQCQTAKIYGTDTTNYTYQNKIGISQNSTWTFAYPMDADGNLPAPVVVTNRPSVIFAVGYNAKGYQLYMNTFSTYSFDDGQSIKIQYKFLRVFDVQCNINLGPVVCEIQKMYAQLTPKCGTTENPVLKDQLFRILVLLSQCIVGIEQPLLGIDVSALIDQIKAIGCFECDCSFGGGINAISNNSGSIILTTDVTGNMTAEFTNVGDNYVLHLELPGGSGIPNLQQVTTEGAITTIPITVGTATGNKSVMSEKRLVISQGTSPDDVLAGIGKYLDADAFGSWWLKKPGGGTVVFRAADGQISYVLIAPATLGSGGFLKFDGSGVGTFAGAPTQDLQEVTDEGNVTTDDIFSGVLAGDYARMSPDIVGLYNNGTKLVAFRNAAGAPIVDFKDSTSAHTLSVTVPSLAVNISTKWPGYRTGGQMALVGAGTVISASVLPFAGTGATVTLDAGSNDSGGIINITPGTSTSAGAQVVVYLSAGYVAAGITPHVSIVSYGQNTSGIFVSAFFVAGAGPGGVDLFELVVGTALGTATTYKWQFVITF